MKALPHTGKKNKIASAVKARLESKVDSKFKVPINLIKHERFKLYWLERASQIESTAGFVVTVLIRPNVQGPASYRFPVPEGFSFASLLRSVLPTIYELCDIAEDALTRAELVSPKTSSSAHPSESAALEKFSRVLDLLSTLPIRGFPNEKGQRVSHLTLQQGGTYVSSTFTIHDFKGNTKFHFNMPPARVGDEYKIPYWVPEKGF
jgi:hypothetical protein